MMPIELKTQASAKIELSYNQLPSNAYSRQKPLHFPRAELRFLNRELAESLGLDAEQLSQQTGWGVFAGQHSLKGIEALAMAYAGHQFGHFNPQLGDGRALLLAEVVAPSGERFDLHLKGSGPTPFARGGDGKAPLGAVIREVLVSEAMHALNVPTTRALAALSTGEEVLRQRSKPGAILVRVARSHIRVGSFEYFSARGDHEGLRALLEYSIHRHLPAGGKDACSALALLDHIIRKQAELVATWQHLGFIHGVMNTDNVLIGGETIDYGPCAFMDTFHPQKVFSSIDHLGRYAYQNQPGIMAWNLGRLANALAPLMTPEESEHAIELIESYEERFLRAFWRGFQHKLGIQDWVSRDEELATDLLREMAASGLDFTLVFRRLSELRAPQHFPNKVESMVNMEPLHQWLNRYLNRVASDTRTQKQVANTMSAANPAIIPRNHQIEAAIRAAEEFDNWQPFWALHKALAQPFELSPATLSFAQPPKPDQLVHQTFCGT